MDDVSRQRLADNEKLLADFNADLRRGVEEGSRPGHSRPVAFACECSNTACGETVRLTLDEYRAARRDERQFVVVCGHEQPDIEAIVERHERYCVVRKHDDLE